VDFKNSLAEQVANLALGALQDAHVDMGSELHLDLDGAGACHKQQLTDVVQHAEHTPTLIAMPRRSSKPSNPEDTLPGRLPDNQQN